MGLEACTVERSIMTAMIITFRTNVAPAHAYAESISDPHAICCAVQTCLRLVLRVGFDPFAVSDRWLAGEAWGLDDRNNASLTSPFSTSSL